MSRSAAAWIALLLVAVLPILAERHPAAESATGVEHLTATTIELAAIHRGAPSHAEASRGTEVERCLACILSARAAGVRYATPAGVAPPPPRPAAEPTVLSPVPAGATVAPSGRAPPSR